MGLAKLVLELDDEIARLRQARALLAGEGPSPHHTQPKKRTLSPEARARIVEGQRRRWAKAKKSAS